MNNCLTAGPPHHGSDHEAPVFCCPCCVLEHRMTERVVEDAAEFAERRARLEEGHKAWASAKSSTPEMVVARRLSAARDALKEKERNVEWAKRRLADARQDLQRVEDGMVADRYALTRAQAELEAVEREAALLASRGVDP